MPLIKRSCIDRIRNQVDIVDLISSYVQLKRSGSTWKGLSPFTTEKTPSFFVNQTKGLFYCFSTGQGGDMFKFIQSLESLNFTESIEFIANRYGIELEYEENSGNYKEEKPTLRKELYLIHELATEFFHDNFMAPDSHGEAIRRYWENDRNFDIAVAKDYKIGFSPIDNSSLLSLLLKKKLSLEALQKCGIFFGPENLRTPQQLRCRFKGRLMIPIRDIQGRVIAFTARKTQFTPNDHASEEGKYINSPETSIFVKNQQLFNLDRAKNVISKGKNIPALLVEGQIDAIRCHSCGITTAIAPQGTSITENQLKLIKRFTGKLECLLDGDAAGQKAAIRLIKLAIPAELEVSCLILPAKEDPDSLFAREGNVALDYLRKNAISAIDFLLQSFLPNITTASAIEKEEALEEIYETFAEIKNPFTAREYMKLVGQRLYNPINPRDDIIYANFENFKQRRSRINQNHGAPTPPQKHTTQFIDPKVQNGLTTKEEILLWIVLNHSDIGEICAEKLDTTWISEKTPAGKLLKRVIVEIREGIWDSNADHSQLWEDQEEEKTYYLCTSVNISNSNIKKLTNDCVKDIYKKHFLDIYENMMKKISTVNNADINDLKSLQKNISSAQNALRNIPNIFDNI